MSEIVQNLLDEFKQKLADNDDISEALMNVLDIELQKEKPNPENIALALQKISRDKTS